MEILGFILEEGFVIIPALYIIAEMIKGTEVIKNKWIPIVLLVISIAGTPLILTGGYTPDNILQAILIAGITVYGNQVVKQLGSDE